MSCGESKDADVEMSAPLVCLEKRGGESTVTSGSNIQKVGGGTGGQPRRRADRLNLETFFAAAGPEHSSTPLSQSGGASPMSNPQRAPGQIPGAVASALHRAGAGSPSIAAEARVHLLASNPAR